MNGESINAPVGNPHVIRQAQWLLEQVQQGRMIGFCAVGITNDGAVSHLHALPQTPSVLQLAIGGLHVIINDLIEVIVQMRQQQSVGRIIKPPNMMQAKNG